MFEARLDDVRILKDSLITVASIVKDKCTFDITKDGLQMTAMDPANVTMVMFNLLAPAFREYKVDKETSITIDIEQLTTVLKRTKPSDQLILKLESDDSIKLIFEGKSHRTFAIPLMTLTEERRPVPKLEFAASVELKAEILKDGIDDASIISENILFRASSEEFKLEAEGDMGKTKLSLTKDSGALISLETKETVDARFSLDYLRKMIGGTKIASAVKINMGQDYPVKLDFTEVDKVSLSFILAPRVDTE